MVDQAARDPLPPGAFRDGPLQRIAGWAICYTFVTYGWLLFFYPVGRVVSLTKALLVWW